MNGYGLRMAATALFIAVAMANGCAQGHLAPGATKKETTTMKIAVDGSVFVAEMYDNDAARAFLAMLPITLDMSEQGGKEKFHQFSFSLSDAPTEKPGVISAGEIMCWSSSYLVLFYSTFRNSYGGYVRLGKLADVAGLEAALGRGDACVAFLLD